MSLPDDQRFARRLAFRKAVAVLVGEAMPADAAALQKFVPLLHEAMEDGYQLGIIAAIQACDRAMRTCDDGEPAILPLVTQIADAAFVEVKTNMKCGWCKGVATHAKGPRAWCDQHTPWAVHWKECDEECLTTIQGR